MANVSYGDMVTELRGKSGNRVYQRTKYGYVQRRKVNPKSTNSSLQQAGRQAIGSLSKQWGILTESDRQAWIMAATYPMTGFNYFMSLNYNAIRFGRSVITNPNYTPFPDTLGYLENSGGITDPLCKFLLTVLDGACALTTDWGDGDITDSLPSVSFNLTHSFTGSSPLQVGIAPADTRLSFSLDTLQSGIVNKWQDPHEALIRMNFSGEIFSTTNVNDLLQAYDAFGTLNGSIDISGQSPAAPPSGAGITAKNSLIAKGWSITTD